MYRRIIIACALLAVVFFSMVGVLTLTTVQYYSGKKTECLRNLDYLRQVKISET